MSEEGYVRVYRRVLDNPVFRDDGEAMMFVWMIMRAAWRPATVRYKESVISLERGQLAISVRDLAARFGRSKTWASRFLDCLGRHNMIGTCAGTGVNVITVCNYDIYQVQPDKAGTLNGTAAGQRRDSGGTQNKEGNKEKEDNKEERARERASGYAFSGKVIRLTDTDFDRWQHSYPSIDVRAALQSRDDWLASEADEKTRKRWFNSTSNHLANLQGKATASAQQAEWQSPC